MQSYTRVVGTVSCSRCRFSMSGHFRDNRSPTMSLDAVRRTCDIASNVSGTCLARRLHEAANALLYNVVDYVDQGINIMSIFGTILSKIFPSSHPAITAPAAPPAADPTTAPAAAPAPAAAAEPVDVEAVLTAMQANTSEQ